MPLLAAAVAFSLLYAVVPNRKVPTRHAMAGGVLAALLFEMAKQGFAFYVTQFPLTRRSTAHLRWCRFSGLDLSLLGGDAAGRGVCALPRYFRDEGHYGSAAEGGAFCWPTAC